MSTNPIADWRQNKTKYTLLGKKGTLLSCTRVVNPPAGQGTHPFWVGVARFGKTRVTAPLIIEGQEPRIGSGVIGVVRRFGEAGPEEHLTYGVKLKVR